MKRRPMEAMEAHLKRESSLTQTQNLNPGDEEEPRHAPHEGTPWGTFSASASLRMEDEEAFLEYLQGEGLDFGVLGVKELEVFLRKWQAQTV